MSATVTSAEAANKFGAYQDAALREPVVITRNGRPRTVLMAYEDFIRLSKRDRLAQRTADLSEAEIAAVEASRMEVGLNDLNADSTDRMLPAEVRVGWVFRYAYLWERRQRQGHEEGDKDRPCLVLALVTTTEDGVSIVRVLPITHSPPSSPDDAIELPATVKRRLGLDGERSWIVLTESNRFVWPGPDLRPVDSATGYFGPLPPALFDEVRRQFVTLARDKTRRHASVARSD